MHKENTHMHVEVTEELLEALTTRAATKYSTQVVPSGRDAFRIAVDRTIGPRDSHLYGDEIREELIRRVKFRLGLVAPAGGGSLTPHVGRAPEYDAPEQSVA
jgi:hypothetical protein